MITSLHQAEICHAWPQHSCNRDATKTGRSRTPRPERQHPSMPQGLAAIGGPAFQPPQVLWCIAFLPSHRGLASLPPPDAYMGRT